MAPTVELDRVRKSYDGIVAVDELSFSINAGSIFGLLGPNGAGKTSTIRMMIGILVPDSGTVRVLGAPLTRDVTDRIGYLPEERGLYRRMTVKDNLVFLGQLAGLNYGEALARGRAFARRLEIDAWFDRRVEELSKGMQQKIQFIAALLHEPDVVILDEPFSGLDPVNTVVLREILIQLKRERRTVVLSTHSMEQAERLCDSICLISRGRVALSGALREIKSRYGKNFVQIEYEGSGDFLRANPLVESCNDSGNHAEVRLKPEADSQALLRIALDHVRVTRFEVMEPSLEQIFVDLVSRRDG